jgi:hypothetical protein
MTTFDYSRLESDLVVLNSVRTVLAATAGSARLASRPSLNPDVGATTDIGIAVEYLDAAMDFIDDAIATIAPHMPGFTPPSAEMDGDRDAGRHCLTCHHDLELDADFRCTRCGSPS